MKPSRIKARVASLILGVAGASYLLSLILSSDHLVTDEAFFKLAMCLTCLSLALEPEFMFRAMTQETLMQPPDRSRAALIMSLAGAACFMVSGAFWLAS